MLLQTKHSEHFAVLIWSTEKMSLEVIDQDRDAVGIDLAFALLAAWYDHVLPLSRDI